MKKDIEILQMINQFQKHHATLSDEEIGDLCESLASEVPGLVDILRRTEENETPEEILQRARREQRIFVLGDGGRDGTLPSNQDDEEDR